MRLFQFWLISTLFFTACSSPSSNTPAPATPTNSTTAWLPDEYIPENPKVIELIDSSTLLLTQLKVDVNLTPTDFERIQNLALNQLEQILTLDKSYGLAYDNLASIYLERKDTTKALELIMMRLKLEPDFAEGWQILGYYRDLQGDSSNAAKDYQKALAAFENRMAMGKKYAKREDVVYFYDNWAGKAYTLLLLGKTDEGHNEIRELLDEVAPIMGEDASIYAALLQQNRYSLLQVVKEQ